MWEESLQTPRFKGTTPVLDCRDRKTQEKPQSGRPGLNQGSSECEAGICTNFEQETLDRYKNMKATL